MKKIQVVILHSEHDNKLYDHNYLDTVYLISCFQVFDLSQGSKNIIHKYLNISTE